MPQETTTMTSAVAAKYFAWPLSSLSSSRNFRRAGIYLDLRISGEGRIAPVAVSRSPRGRIISARAGVCQRAYQRLRSVGLQSMCARTKQRQRGADDRPQHEEV